MELLYDIQLDNGIEYKAKGEDNIPLKCGDYCIIRKDFFLDYGKVISPGVPFDPALLPKEPVSGTPTEKKTEVPRIQRKANVVDQGKANENAMRAKSALRTTAGLVEHLKLEMKLINAHYAFDGKLLTIQFSAEGRVDFRELVKQLSSTLNTRIELRQIGVRGDGICPECRSCQFHRPYWKYQSCVFEECPYSPHSLSTRRLKPYEKES